MWNVEMSKKKKKNKHKNKEPSLIPGVKLSRKMTHTLAALRKLSGMNKEISEQLIEEFSIDKSRFEVMDSIKQLFSEHEELTNEFDGILWEIVGQKEDDYEQPVIESELELFRVEDKIVGEMKGLMKLLSRRRALRFSICEQIRKMVDPNEVVNKES